MTDLVAGINKDRIRDRELSDRTKMEYKKALKKMCGDFLESKREYIDGERLTDFFSTTVFWKRTDPDAYIFRSSYENQMSYNAAYSIIGRAVEDVEEPRSTGSEVRNGESERRPHRLPSHGLGEEFTDKPLPHEAKASA
ncbi:MAG: hypothetical protein ABEJ95_03740 [Candidatus Nanohalobium sp.]